jgi:hypothetical protein
MAGKKQNKVSGIDCNYYGKAYASALLKNPRLRVSDLPSLQYDDEFAKLKESVRCGVIQTIRGVARSLLCDAGYNQDALNKVFINNQ